MGVGKFLGKAVTGIAKTAGSIVLGTVGAASTVVEYLGAGIKHVAFQQESACVRSDFFGDVGTRVKG